MLKYFFENNTLGLNSSKYTGYLNYEKLDKGNLTFTPYNISFSFGDGKDQQIDFISTNRDLYQEFYIDIAKF